MIRSWTRLGLASLIAIFALACGGGDEVPEFVTPIARDAVRLAAEPTATAPAPTVPSVAPTAIPGEPSAQSGISDALGQTAAASSGRMAGSIRMSGLEELPVGTEVSLPFSGEFDNEAGIFAFKMDLSKIAETAGEGLPLGLADLLGEMEIRTFGDITYLRFPFFSAFLGVDSEWIKLPADQAGSAAGGFSAGVSPANPTGALDVFKDAEAAITDLGEARVRGVKTTHYLLLIDMQKLLATATPEERAEIEAQGPLPFDELPLQLWIGDDGFIYRYVMTVSGAAVQTAPGEGFERMTMTFEIFDYGAAINIEEPPASDVTDAEELGGLFDLF